MSKLAIENARIVTPAGVIEGAMTFEGDTIASIANGSAASAMDAEGDLIIPGLIDIHTDNLEKHLMPRPGAQWDSAGAALAHDGQMATAGVTTVFDSLSLSGMKNGLDRGEALTIMMGGMDQAESAGALRIDHLLHLRCEVTNPDIEDLVTPYLGTDRLKMLSVMDHTPGGNRQSGTLDAWKQKMLKRGRTMEEIEANLQASMSWRDLDGADARRRMIAEFGRDHEIPVASHDDATADHIETAVGLGCNIAEFPVSYEAAESAKQHNMVTVMGGPNFVRGRSHGDNASARKVAEAGQLDALCSDYVPLSMIRAAFMLTEAPFSWPIEKAIGTVSAEPAKMAMLNDRGTLEVGKRADFVRVSYKPGHWPIIKGVWSRGRRAA
ncbi:MAG: alpha-D-ribose 1-methylphosphonate 5-triphosphate diphosphatase [Pseudomonadota bacterium]